MIDDWLRGRRKKRAMISDIDDTICKSFDVPIAAACEFLRRLDSSIEVYYITSRPEESRAGTETFFESQSLNRHQFSPGRLSDKSNRASKSRTSKRARLCGGHACS